MNLFAGARRLAVVIAVPIVGVGAYAVYDAKPYVAFQYRIPGFGERAVRWGGECSIGVDALEYKSYVTPKGTPFSIRFCFAASRADNGQMLVPYKIDTNFLLLDGPYSTNVTNYTRAFTDAVFAPSDNDYREADEQYTKLVLIEKAKTAGGATLVLLAYWLLVKAIGWIVRGFLGVPEGHDNKARPS